MAPSQPAPADPEFFSRQVVSARRFYLNLDPRPRDPLTVVCGGWERCAPDYAIRRSGFPYLAIEFLAAGRVTLHMGPSTLRLGPGAVFAYGPGVAHEIHADPKHRPWKYFLCFTGPRARVLMRSAGLEPGAVRQVPNPLPVRDLFDHVLLAGQRRTAAAPEICAALVEALLLTLGDTAVEHGTHTERAYVTYQRCREWLDQHGSTVRTLQEAARRCHVDAAYLCRLFRRFDRESPYQFLLRSRMERAAQRLHEPESSVKGVAAEAGYSDAFHFSRAFKRCFGISPSEFVRRTG
jgi:AraC-like DNA-binding protein